MSKVKVNCSACGVQLELDIAEPFARAGLVGSLCPACADRQFLHGDGAIMELRPELEGARFPLGKVTVTPGAVAALAESAQHAATFLARHVRGDWGAYGEYDEIELTELERRKGWEATDEDAKINKSNLLNRRDRIMSEYQTSRGNRLWIITNLDRSEGTTVLLPEEY